MTEEEAQQPTDHIPIPNLQPGASQAVPPVDLSGYFDRDHMRFHERVRAYLATLPDMTITLGGRWVQDHQRHRR